MQNIFDKLMYDSGLTANGCWNNLDEYDRSAIQRYGSLIIAECARCALRNDDVFTAQDIFNHFGIKE
jgi:hypothetical protein